MCIRMLTAALLVTVAESKPTVVTKHVCATECVASLSVHEAQGHTELKDAQVEWIVTLQKLHTILFMLRYTQQYGTFSMGTYI